MKGELIEVWGDTWREIWSPLLEHEEYADDLMMDIYRTLVPLPDPPTAPDPSQLEYDEEGKMLPVSMTNVAVYESERAVYEHLRAQHEEFATGSRDLRREFNSFLKSEIKTEADACQFLKDVNKIIETIGDDGFLAGYRNLIEKFLIKYSLRYDLRPPFHLCPTLPGIFAKLLSELRRFSAGDPHLQQMMDDFEEGLRDLRISNTSARIRSVIRTQINLIEAVGGMHPNANKAANRNTLGAISEDVDTWPHDQIKQSLKEMYGFTCDYPGIRHGGNPQSSNRNVDMRDLVAVSVILTGFLPYLTDQIDPAQIYLGH